MFLIEKYDRVSREVVAWDFVRDYSKALDIQKEWTTESTWATVDNMS